MFDVNKVKIKHHDIIKISNSDWFCNDGKLLAVKTNIFRDDYMPDEFVIYNPNCCKFCKDGEACIDGLSVIDPLNIEVVGNLDTTPELLPLKDFKEAQ